MAYITNMPRALIHELTKFAGLRRHQLVGQVANLDFWLAEARHCFSILDGYAALYERMADAQTKFVLEHKVVEFDPRDPGRTNSALTPPRRSTEGALKKMRAALCVAVYGFLVRCCNKGFIKPGLLRKECASFGIVVEESDLKKR